MVVAHDWRSNLRKFKAKPGLHSSGTARESYILRPCLKKQKPKRKKRREESLWTRFPFAFKITRFLWMLTHGCSFVVIILFDFYTEVTLLELSMFVYLILPISLVYTKLLFVNTTMHCTSQSLSSGTRVGKETSWGCVKTCRPQVHMLLLLLLWTWPRDSPSALYPSPGCTVSCEPCGDLWGTSWLHEHLTRPCITM